MISFMLFIILGSAFYLNSWNNEFVRDDLHLIRSYTLNEIAGTFVGTWDPDEIETHGYRPITTLFNHTRYAIFGENVILHRCFLIALMALLLTVLCDTFVLLGANVWTSILAGAMVICSCNNFYHIAWLSDGIHIFAGLLSIASLNLVIRGYFNNSTAEIVLAHILGFLGVLTRDESLALYIIAFTFPVFYSFIFNERGIFKSKLLIKYILPGILISSLYLTLRVLFIPPSNFFFLKGSIHKVLAHGFSNLTDSFCQTFNFLGLLGRTGPIVWLGIIAVFTFLGFLYGHTTRHRRVLMLFGIYLLISMAPMSFLYRQNLLLNPSCFACGIVALSLEPMFRRGPRIVKAVLSVLLCALIIFTFKTSQTCQEALHPCSTATIVAYWEFFILHKKASVPIERKARIMKQLHSLGFKDFENYTTNDFWVALNKKSKNSSPSEPKTDEVFIPKRRFLGFPFYLRGNHVSAR